MVVWTSVSGDGSDRGIFGRQFDAGGAAGPEFQVNTYATGRQHLPAGSSDAAGNFIIVWQSNGQDGNGYGVYAQRSNASSVAQGLGFRVNAYTTGPHRSQGQLRNVGARLKPEPLVPRPAALTRVLSSNSASGATRRRRQIGA